MNDKTRHAIEQDKRFLWHPFTPMDAWLDPGYEPVMITSGDGAELIDTEGRRYLDGNSSIWTNLHGHGHPQLTKAIQEQAALISHSSALGLGNPLAAELAEKLVGLLPEETGPYRVFLSDDGSTAMECALKIAWQYFQQNGQPQRTQFLGLTGSYHGDTVGAMSLGKSGSFHAPYQPILFPTHEIPAPDCLRCPQRKNRQSRIDVRLACGCGPRPGESSLVAMEQKFVELGDTVAALVLEPRVMGAAGMVMHPPGFLAAAAALAKRHGALLILDEIMVGFGRTGKMLAEEHEGVTGDLIALAKGLTAGTLPLGATLVKNELFEGFRGGLERTFFHGHSYSGNQLGCAAALANLEIFATEPVLERVAERATWLREASQCFLELPQVAEIRQEGLILAIELVQDRESLTPFPTAWRVAHQITERARRDGLLTRGLGSILFLLPPYCSTQEQIEKMVAALFHSTKEVLLEIASTKGNKAEE